MSKITSGPADTAALQQSTLLVPSIHCPTCTEFIESLLLGLDPPPSSVSASIVNHSVTIRYNDKVNLEHVARTLTDVGYEVDSIIPENESVRDVEAGAGCFGPSDDSLLFSWVGALVHSPSRTGEEERRQRHMEHCTDCRDGTLQRRSGSVSDEKPKIVVHDSSPLPTYMVTMTLEGMSCASCVGTITAALEEQHWIESASVNLLDRTAVVKVFDRQSVAELPAIIRSIGYDATVEEVHEVQETMANGVEPNNDTWRASFSVSGMSCSSCVGTITAALEELPWTRSVDVNLISGSMTVVFNEKRHLNDIMSAVQDVGYAATLSDIVEANASGSRDTHRNLSFRIDGLYCPHCPGKIQDSLAARFGVDVRVEKPPTQEKPLMTVSYVPSPPRLHVRSILETVSDADPAFHATIYHPPTVEERAKQMMRRTRLRIFLRVLASFIVGIPTLIIGIVYMNLVSHSDATQRYLMEPLSGVSRADWALLALASPVYFFCADVFHRRTIKELYSLWRPGSRVPLLRRFYRFGSMDMLVSFATSIAYFSSVAEIIIAATASGEHHGKIPAHLDAVVFLTLFLLAGRMIEAYSKAKTGEAVSKLGSLRPKEALLLIPDEKGSGRQTKSVPIDMLDTGDLVRVVHGASPPWDGILIEGHAEFIESSLTGESRPIEKQLGDPVFSGTVNKGGPITIRLTGASGGSLLDSIIKLVREGQARRAPIERVADAITGYFVPAVTLFAIVTWLTWLGLGLSGRLPESYKDITTGGWAFWSLQFAIAVFVIACPCGIGLAAPTALFVGGGLAAKHGILAKGGGEAFQEASKLNIVVFDKTGTLTEGGEPKLTNHRLLADSNAALWSEEVILSFLGELEGNSSHPIAKAVVTFCASKASTKYRAEQVKEIPGKGIRGLFKAPPSGEPVEVIVGNEALMADYGVNFDRATLEELDTWKDQAKSVVLVAGRSSDGANPSTWVPLVTLAVSDALRPEARPVLEALRSEGIDVWMISGDNEKTARAVGAMLDIPADRIMAGVLPEQKAEKIRYLQKSQVTLSSFLGIGKPKARRPVVAMVGDGVNDSPALTVADVGIAIGSGSDVAISAAEFVLVNSSLTTLLTLTRLSRAVFRRVKFNFAWALVYNMVALPIAAGVLYPIKTNGGHTRLDPVWAALAMALSSLSVISSSLLLRTPLPLIGFTNRAAKRS
ncbi:hypothetical protein ACHAQA_009557 [Verticillium albo-atrum]